MSTLCPSKIGWICHNGPGIRQDCGFEKAQAAKAAREEEEQRQRSLGAVWDRTCQIYSDIPSYMPSKSSGFSGVELGGSATTWDQSLFVLKTLDGCSSLEVPVPCEGNIMFFTSHPKTVHVRRRKGACRGMEPVGIQLLWPSKIIPTLAGTWTPSRTGSTEGRRGSPQILW